MIWEQIMIAIAEKSNILLKILYLVIYLLNPKEGDILLIMSPDLFFTIILTFRLLSNVHSDTHAHHKALYIKNFWLGVELNNKSHLSFPLRGPQALNTKSEKLY